jgi:hypothetical protein
MSRVLSQVRLASGGPHGHWSRVMDASSTNLPTAVDDGPFSLHCSNFTSRHISLRQSAPVSFFRVWTRYKGDSCAKTWWTVSRLWLAPAQIYLAELVVAEVDVKAPVRSPVRPYSDRQPSKRFRDGNQLASKTSVTMKVHSDNCVFWTVLKLWKCFRIRPWTHSVVGRWRCHLESLVRPLVVIDVPPIVEGKLGFAE